MYQENPTFKYVKNILCLTALHSVMLLLYNNTIPVMRTLFYMYA